MQCFSSLVGVRNLCDPAAPTGMYLDDIGLTRKDLTDFMPAAFANEEAYFASRLAQASREIEYQALNHFSPKYVAASLVDNHRLGIFGSTIETAALAGYGGIQLEFTQPTGFFKFLVSEVSLRLNHDGNVDVVVYDLRQGKLLDTLSITSVSGEIATGTLNKYYYSDRQPLNLFIGYNTAGIASSNKTLIKQGLCCGQTSCSNSYLSAQGVTLSGGFYDANTTGLSHTSGVSLIYSIECDHQGWMCAHALAFASSVSFKTASLIIADAIHGNRSVNATIVNPEDTERRYDFYMSKFHESFSTVLNNIRTPSGRCFSCNTPIRTRALAI